MRRLSVSPNMGWWHSTTQSNLSNQELIIRLILLFLSLLNSNFFSMPAACRENNKLTPFIHLLGFSSKTPMVGLYHQRLTLHILSINRFHWLFSRLIISDQHPAFFHRGTSGKHTRPLAAGDRSVVNPSFPISQEIFLFLKKSTFHILCGGGLKAASMEPQLIFMSLFRKAWKKF